MLSLLLQAATDIAAQPAVVAAPVADGGAIDFSMTFVKMMAALIAVCILAILILKFAVPKMGIMKRFQSGRMISIVSKATLEQKRQLYLIKVGTKYALVGSSEGGVSHIMDVPATEVEQMESE